MSEVFTEQPEALEESWGYDDGATESAPYEQPAPYVDDFDPYDPDHVAAVIANSPMGQLVTALGHSYVEQQNEAQAAGARQIADEVFDTIAPEHGDFDRDEAYNTANEWVTNAWQILVDHGYDEQTAGQILVDEDVPKLVLAEAARELAARGRNAEYVNGPARDEIDWARRIGGGTPPPTQPAAADMGDELAWARRYSDSRR
jgi:hypothetical protein